MLVLPALGACTRTTRPVPVPAELEPWPTVLETTARAPWADEAVPLQPREVWRIDVGKGFVAPLAIRGDLLLLTTMDRRAAVIAAATGSYFWERRLYGAAPDGLVFDTRAVYVAAQERNAAAQAFDLERGMQLWRVEMEMPIGAPLIVDGTTYWSTEPGRLYALRATDGVRLWRTTIPRGLTGTPVPWRDALLVSSTADTLYLVGRNDGGIRARTPLPATVSATPALIGDALLLPLHDTTVVSVDLRPWISAASGVPATETGDEHEPAEPAPVITSWPLEAVVRAAPVIAPDSTIYLLDEHASVYAWHLDEAPRRIAALGGAARRSLSLARDAILVGRLDGMLFLLRRNGSIVWELDMEDSIEAPVAAHRGALFVPLMRGDLVKLIEDIP